MVPRWPEQARSPGEGRRHHRLLRRTEALSGSHTHHPDMQLVVGVGGGGCTLVPAPPRHMPPDSVTQSAISAHTDVWTQTHTYISHITRPCNTHARAHTQREPLPPLLLLFTTRGRATLLRGTGATHYRLYGARRPRSRPRATAGSLT